MEKNKEIAIYKSKDGKVTIDVSLKEKTLWLPLNGIAKLFARNKSVISRHLSNIFKEKELDKSATVAKNATVQIEGGRHIEREIEYYNLDAIISVGYRVNSRQATQFRIWATDILKTFLVEGYAINEKHLKTQESKIKELQKVVNVMAYVVDQRNLESDEAVALLKVISDYTQALDLLDRYDHDTLKLEKNNLSAKKVKQLKYEEAISVIKELSKQFGASSLFGKEKDKSFRSSIEGIYQTFDGKELYPSIEEKASNLIYFLVKNHSFVDGNKRIAASLFLYFINKNGILYKKDGTRILNDNALVAITLMIAESKPVHKNTIVKMLVNLIDKKN